MNSNEFQHGVVVGNNPPVSGTANTSIFRDMKRPTTNQFGMRNDVNNRHQMSLVGEDTKSRMLVGGGNVSGSRSYNCETSDFNLETSDLISKTDVHERDFKVIRRQTDMKNWQVNGRLGYYEDMMDG
eukprot:gnl/Chilomastix_caulleri/1302.p1 GENE.gnl/Chilomastix_caulleri/1302~~gnl/Chilomastix_caulleri/1302.p1  ORF type:complete len:127 (+),score=20.55 gnl/Chilomastix_caulleri/1302:335-715(+)